MQYIELMGLPGSGKTALAQNVMKRLQRPLRGTYTRLEIKTATMRRLAQQKSGVSWQLLRIVAVLAGSRLWPYLWNSAESDVYQEFLHQHPRLVSFIIECAAETAPPDWIPAEAVSRRSLLNWFREVITFYEAARRFLTPGDLFLQEEGFCQHAYYLLAFRRGQFDPQDARRYLHAIPTPDLLIFLTTPGTICEERMHSRSKGVSSQILRSLTVDQRLGLLEQRFAIYQQIADELEARRVPVLRLANENYEQTCAALQQALDTLEP